MINAVLWDFGGVILSSPFDAFAEYEAAAGLPHGFIRRLNATNPDDNAWSHLERNLVDVEGFCQLFEAEAIAAGFEVDARQVIAALEGRVRPEMVEALRRCRTRFKTACLTNNFVSASANPDRERMLAPVWELFDVIVESSKVGVRKPDSRFYEMACSLLEVAPDECVFLDDLGVNLKPAKAMGMTTIKVESAEQALGELEAVVGLDLR